MVNLARGKECFADLSLIISLCLTTTTASSSLSNLLSAAAAVVFFFFFLVVTSPDMILKLSPSSYKKLSPSCPKLLFPTFFLLQSSLLDGFQNSFSYYLYRAVISSPHCRLCVSIVEPVRDQLIVLGSWPAAAADRQRHLAVGFLFLSASPACMEVSCSCPCGMMGCHIGMDNNVNNDSIQLSMNSKKLNKYIKYNVI